MKQFVLYLCFSVVTGLHAQPMVDGTAFTNAGTVLTYDMAAPAWLANFDPMAISGGDVNWNFSNFESASSLIEPYVPVTTAPAIYQFYFNNAILFPDHFSTHARNLSVEETGIEIPIELSDIYGFFRNDATGYYITGTAFSFSGFPLNTPFTSIDRVMKFPVVFGDQDSTFSQFLIEIPILGVYGQSGFRYNHVDAWGTIETSYGTFETLRIRSERHLTDTAFINQNQTGESVVRPVQVDYIWVSQDAPGPVMEASVINGQVVAARILSGISVDISNLSSENGFKIYPNPANYVLHVNHDFTEGIMRIWTIDGKLLKQINLGSGISKIDTDLFPVGMYLMEIISEGKTTTQRFVVSRD